MIFSYEIFYNLYKRIREDKVYYEIYGSDKRLEDIETFKKFVDMKLEYLPESTTRFKGFKEHSNIKELVRLLRILGSRNDMSAITIESFSQFKCKSWFSLDESMIRASYTTEARYVILYFEGVKDKFGCLDSMDVSSSIEYTSSPVTHCWTIDKSRKSNYIVPDTIYEQFYEFCVAYKELYNYDLDKLFNTK